MTSLLINSIVEIPTSFTKTAVLLNFVMKRDRCEEIAKTFAKATVNKLLEYINHKAGLNWSSSSYDI